jgi:xylulose-5-phosphate/fructose-6-phosphate phosphoketolase
VLHLNGYKISNPTVLARIPRDELEALLIGYGHKPYFVEGDDPSAMHQQMASTMARCILEIRSIQQHARSTGDGARPRWPMIVLRSPKGWTGPRVVDGHKVEGSWRAHQVPVSDPVTNENHLNLVEEWLRSHKPAELFDLGGRLIPELQDLAPTGPRRISANPHANGGVLRKELEVPDFRHYTVEVKAPGAAYALPTDVLVHFLAEVMRHNMSSFRVFGPDETASNKLTAIYAASKKTWLAEFKPEDADGGELDVSGRVMEMLS